MGNLPRWGEVAVSPQGRGKAPPSRHQRDQHLTLHLWVSTVSKSIDIELAQSRTTVAVQSIYTYALAVDSKTNVSFSNKCYNYKPENQ